MQWNLNAIDGSAIHADCTTQGGAQIRLTIEPDVLTLESDREIPPRAVADALWHFAPLDANRRWMYYSDCGYVSVFADDDGQSLGDLVAEIEGRAAIDERHAMADRELTETVEPTVDYMVAGYADAYGYSFLLVIAA